MVYTLAKLRDYARNVDSRLEDTDKYSDAWIDERVEEGLALAQDIKQSLFFTTEKYDIESNIVDDGLDEVEIVPQREVHSMWVIDYNVDSYEVSVTANNHVIIKRIENTPVPKDFIITIRYFFYFTLPFTEVEMSMEVYKMCKSTIAATCFQWLKDKDSEQYHTKVAMDMSVRSTFDIEKSLTEIPIGRLWSRSWV